MLESDLKPRRWSLEDVPSDIRNDPTKVGEVGAWIKAHVAKLADEDAAVAAGYSYVGIPRDGDGIPTYIILPPDTRTYYEERLTSFEKSWRATQDPGYCSQATQWAGIWRQPHPPWLVEAERIVAAGMRAPEHDRRYREDQRHLLRYQVVRALIDAGCDDEEEAFDKARVELKKIKATASRHTIATSYRRVRDDLKARRFARYVPFARGDFRTVNGRPVK